MSHTSMGHDLTRNDPEQQGGRRESAEEAAAHYQRTVKWFAANRAAIVARWKSGWGKGGAK